MNEAPGPINFTMFLTLFGERLNGTDPQEVIRNAFGCFDEDTTGFIHVRTIGSGEGLSEMLRGGEGEGNEKESWDRIVYSTNINTNLLSR